MASSCRDANAPSYPEPCRCGDNPYMLRVFRSAWVPIMASFGYASTLYGTGGMPDPVALPEAYEGVLWRRTLAYFVDLCVIGVIAVFCWIIFAVLWLLSFGLLGPVLWCALGLIPLAYHTFLLSGPRSATLGMRIFDVEL